MQRHPPAVPPGVNINKLSAPRGRVTCLRSVIQARHRFIAGNTFASPTRRRAAGLQRRPYGSLLFLGCAGPGRAMKTWPFRLLATLLAVCVGTAAVVSLWPGAEDVRVDDRNGDGAPDVWRLYDHDGQLSLVAV